MDIETPKKTSFTYELTEEQQEKLLGLMLNGNYRKREVPYSIWSIECNNDPRVPEASSHGSLRSWRIHYDLR